MLWTNVQYILAKKWNRKTPKIKSCTVQWYNGKKKKERKGTQRDRMIERRDNEVSRNGEVHEIIEERKSVYVYSMWLIIIRYDWSELMCMWIMIWQMIGGWSEQWSRSRVQRENKRLEVRIRTKEILGRRKSRVGKKGKGSIFVVRYGERWMEWTEMRYRMRGRKKNGAKRSRKERREHLWFCWLVAQTWDSVLFCYLLVCREMFPKGAFRTTTSTILVCLLFSSLVGISTVDR